MSKNEKLLKSFTNYCKANPKLRFWQALINWAGFDISKVTISDGKITYKDLFYE